MKFADVYGEVERRIAGSSSADDAMDRCVRALAAAMPHYTWVGIYVLHSNELVLGPFVGKPSPHTRIPLGRGICGAAAAEKATIIVDDVNADPRYLACSVETRSEIVVPIIDDPRGRNEVLGEIDIDSDGLAAFNGDDRELLEAVAEVLVPWLRSSSRSWAQGSGSAQGSG